MFSPNFQKLYNPGQYFTDDHMDGSGEGREFNMEDHIGHDGEGQKEEMGEGEGQKEEMREGEGEKE